MTENKTNTITLKGAKVTTDEAIAELKEAIEKGEPCEVNLNAFLSKQSLEQLNKLIKLPDTAYESAFPVARISPPLEAHQGKGCWKEKARKVTQRVKRTQKKLYGGKGIKPLHAIEMVLWQFGEREAQRGDGVSKEDLERIAAQHTDHEEYQQYFNRPGLFFVVEDLHTLALMVLYQVATNLLTITLEMEHLSKQHRISDYLSKLVTTEQDEEEGLEDIKRDIIAAVFDKTPPILYEKYEYEELDAVKRLYSVGLHLLAVLEFLAQKTAIPTLFEDPTIQAGRANRTLSVINDIVQETGKYPSGLKEEEYRKWMYGGIQNDTDKLMPDAQPSEGYLVETLADVMNTPLPDLHLKRLTIDAINEGLRSHDR